MPSPAQPAAKRQRQLSPSENESPGSAAVEDSPAGTEQSDGTKAGASSAAGGGGGGGGGPGGGNSTSFRNVSACNRCRLRKNRCDQKLPSCASCAKAGVSCVGYDPITKREIPRSYVFYLETRVDQLETLLAANNIQAPSADKLEYCSRPGAQAVLDKVMADASDPMVSHAPTDVPDTSRPQSRDGDDVRPGSRQTRPGGGKPRSLGSTNGISFARVVFAAVQSSVGDQKSSSDKTGPRPSKRRDSAHQHGGAGGTSMRDSFFGLHTRPTINPAEFPDRELASKLVSLYFEHANPQIPVLHRGEFMEIFDLAYSKEDSGRACGSKELYILNMVFAIGGGIIMDAQATSTGRGGALKRQAQPEEYHASAIVHLEACLANSGGGLEELQAVLLLANFALLRPVPPGLWYIVGVAVRLAVDLGLHYEDGKDVEFDLAGSAPSASSESREAQFKEKGRREFVRDLRRRLWWCTYSLDRLVSTCVGRPFGVSDQVITTEFPSLLEDKFITAQGFTRKPVEGEPTYKAVARHYFRLRLLQSEILQVLQYQQTQIARFNGQNVRNEYMHTNLPSPFLARFTSFRDWRRHIDQRLFEWKASAPTKAQSGVAFSPEFLELNYWQTIIMLYRQSLSVPSMFEGEYNTSKEVNSPSVFTAEQRDDEERVYLKVAEAGQKILRLYRQLHLVGLVNYTYLATHHLFMAGISYLYAIWHSPIVRSRLTMDEVDFTMLAATSVFTDLIDKCPPAEACRDAFDRTAKATIRMAHSTGGFGQVLLSRNQQVSRGSGDNDYISSRDAAANNRNWHPARRSLENTAAFHQSPNVYGYASAAAAAAGSATTQDSPATPYPRIKTEQDGYSALRTPLPGASAGENMLDGMSAHSNLDPVLSSVSPAAGQVGSPISVRSLTPRSATAPQYPGGMAAGDSSTYGMLRSPPAGYGGAGSDGVASLSYSDLQGMDFLQELHQQPGQMDQDSDVLGGVGGGGFGDPDMQMDVGLGMGWEGMHHDFSDGQQVDLFDGFFFGGSGGNG
ncbi:fungal-specific transcription factor domain-domain-containing protein, partial [Microdochium bolleyi]